jgi:hypothetical protein
MPPDAVPVGQQATVGPTPKVEEKKKTNKTPTPKYLLVFRRIPLPKSKHQRIVVGQVK